MVSRSSALDSRYAGQAQHTIAGFRYQILQSVLALLQLGEDGELWLEVSEDFSIVSGDIQTDVQVKNTQATVRLPTYSLQSEVIRKAIIRFWDGAQVNSSKTTRLVFLARGGASTERGHLMPDGVTGLAYWQAAAIDADTGPLRKLLADSLHDTSVGDWLSNNPTDDELRDRLLRRVFWQLEARSSDAVFVEARDELRIIYRSMNLPVSAADLAVRGLIALVFEKASKPETTDRKLTRVDLEAELELVAGQGMVIERRQRAAMSAESLLVSQPGISARSARRAATVENLVDSFRGQPLLWLYGAHGVGKSTLAKLTAAMLGGRWIVFDIWPVKDDLMGALAAWGEVAHRALAGDVDGIILDNVVESSGDAVLERLRGFVEAFQTTGGRVIATSHHKPSALQLADLGTAQVVSAPYFTDADVEELILQKPSPMPDMIKAWTLFVRVTAGAGHPTLVGAKIASLRARNWPNSALMEDFGPPSDATRETREASRRKLLAELSDLDDALSLEARQLLRRIASVFDRVDEPLIFRLAKVEPPIQNVGDALAVLKGTWLEFLPLGDLKVSPLLADIGNDLPVDESQRFKQVAAVHWLSGRILNERTLPLCFWNAFLGKHDGVLMKLSETMHGLGADKLRAAAPMLSTLTVFATDRSMYDGHPVAAASVRVLQFAVADALDNQEVASRSADRLLVELDELTEPYRTLMTTVSTFRVLLSDADLSPALRIKYALKLKNCLPLPEIIADQLQDPSKYLPPGLRPDMDVADFLVTRMVQKIRSTPRFLEAIEAFDELTPEVRNRFLDTIDLTYGGLSVFVSSGWSGDQISGSDMDAALSGYTRVEAVTGQWDRQDIRLELAVSKSVVMDESLNLKEQALELIEGAILDLGHLPGAIRQKARVLSHMGRYEEAADLTLSIEDSLSPGDNLERSLALRDGAVSLGKSKRYAEAARLFDKSHEVLVPGDNRSPLRTGLLVEHALSLWRDGKKPHAIELAASILLELETYEISASRQAERAHQYGRALVGLFSVERARIPAETPPPFDFGQASQIELNDAELIGAELPLLADNWRVLAGVEADVGAECGVGALSLEKQNGSLSVPIERDYQLCRLCYAIYVGNITDALTAYASLHHLFSIPTASGDRYKRAAIELFTPDIPSFRTVDDGALARQSVLDVIAYRVALGTYNHAFLRRMSSEYQAVLGDTASVQPVLDAATHLYAVNPALRQSLIANALTMPNDRIANDASDRLHRDVFLITHSEFSIIRDELRPAATALILKGWRKLATDFGGDFEIDIVDAISSAPGNVELQTANVLLVAKDWVNHRFAEGWFDCVRRLGTQQFGHIPVEAA